MQTDSFEAWLQRRRKKDGRPLEPSTVYQYVRDATRVEEDYGDLDSLYEKDRLACVMETLTYTAEDARNNAPNPSKMDTTLNALSGYKTAIKQYRDYRDSRIGAK